MSQNTRHSLISRLRTRTAVESLLADRSFTSALTARPYVHETYAFNFVARERWIIPPGQC